ncbi:hypothetical protein [Paenibacillus wynnii]|uniref:Uncharacterized protein n=1 Tax=Paenibacillus wynnii TaxID=268407 RepID=A0A098M909_9BACL|nr:hypothetical protein [Paenibacillus wynnii]KGE19029.1 hypothetical protein PWYN_06450 [Paenibacillus wynnii]
MKIFCLGMDQLSINDIKNAGYTVVTQTVFPEPLQTEGHILIVSSDITPVSELGEFRTRYTNTTLIYMYLHKGVKGYKAVHMLCESQGIYFLPPRITAAGMIEKIQFIVEEEGDSSSNWIGFFGSGPGIGCTTAAKLFARRIAATGQRVILLGLDLYDPGYDRKAVISLDRLRPRITGKMLNDDDFEAFIKQEGYLYLPGNYDFLSAQDYQEDEIQYLLAKAGENADVVVADFGSIPESAAWYVGMQSSALRMMVTHPKHQYRLEPLLELAGQLDLHAHDFNIIINRCNVEEMLSPKNMALRFGSEILLEIPYYPPFQDSLPLGKKELQLVDGKVQSLLVALGMVPEARKKAVFL